MPATAAQVKANKANAAKSTGPKTPEGKEASRANSYKHGLTGAGIVLPQAEAVEVERRTAAFATELVPSGEVGIALVRLAATMSVRAERCVGHENAVLAERVRLAEADFVPPAGVSEPEAARLRLEAGKRALFDPSKEAILARKYEVAAVRTFFRALKELRLVEKQAKVVDQAAVMEQLGSILPGDTSDMTDEEFEKMYAETMAMLPQMPTQGARPDAFETLRGRVDVPFSIGKSR
jgi:hypothetical protein